MPRIEEAPGKATRLQSQVPKQEGRADAEAARWRGRRRLGDREGPLQPVTGPWFLLSFVFSLVH